MERMASVSQEAMQTAPMLLTAVAAGGVCAQTITSFRLIAATGLFRVPKRA